MAEFDDGPVRGEHFLGLAGPGDHQHRGAFRKVQALALIGRGDPSGHAGSWTHAGDGHLCGWFADEGADAAGW
jgi:hypothetical protein